MMLRGYDVDREGGLDLTSDTCRVLVEDCSSARAFTEVLCLVIDVRCLGIIANGASTDVRFKLSTGGKPSFGLANGSRLLTAQLNSFIAQRVNGHFSHS